MNRVTQVRVWIPEREYAILKTFTHMKTPGQVATQHIPFKAVLQKSDLPVGDYR
jgi:hypothetical protein